jgi:hypothetical protein
MLYYLSLGSIPDCVIGIFHRLKSFRPHCGRGFDSASKRNEYQEYTLGGKGGRCVGLTTVQPSCFDCLEFLGASTSCSPKDMSRPAITLRLTAFLRIFCPNDNAEWLGMPAFFSGGPRFHFLSTDQILRPTFPAICLAPPCKC